MNQEIVKLLNQLLAKSLTNTRPLVITDTVENTGIDALAIYAITDTTFTTLNAVYQGNDLATQTLSKGHIWYIPIKGSVKLATGSVIIYQNVTSGN